MGKVLVLFFGSGFTSLIYQVLWMRELGLLFGNTSHAAAVTLTAFFIGLAVGGYAWGKRAEKLNNPLRTYGYLVPDRKTELTNKSSTSKPISKGRFSKCNPSCLLFMQF